MIRRLFARIGLPALAALVATAVFIPVFFGHYFNYGAESISIVSLSRLAGGRVWVSSLEESPLLISAFNPLYLVPAWPVAWIVGPDSTLALAVTGRLVCLSALTLLLVQVREIHRTYWSGLYSERWHRVTALLVVLSFSSIVFAFRPDFVSFLIEATALAQLLRGRTARAGLLTGVAVVAKFNTLGLFVGGTVWLLTRRRIRDAAVFGGTGAAVVGAASAALYALFGEPVLTSHWSALVSDTVTLDLTFVRGVLAGFALPHGFFLFLVVDGMWRLRRNAPEAAGLVASYLLFSFAIAAAGQFRQGAYHNYFYGFFAVGIIPASSSAAHWLSTGTRSLAWSTFLVTLVFHGVSAMRAPAAVILNQLPNYPQDELRGYLDARWPGARIYSPDPNLLVIFRARAVIGPWAEPFVESSPVLRKYTPRIRQALRRAGRIDLALVSGRSCASWRPQGVLAPDVAHLRVLDRQFGKLCVFSHD